MLKRFLARRRTIESITAPITRIVDKLQVHADLHTDKANEHEDRAAYHVVAASAAKSQVERAKEQADKFASLVR